MGKNRIGDILTNARKKFNFKGRKVANHSVRKTGLTRLLHADIPETFVTQHAGMKHIGSLTRYIKPGINQIENMSAILTNQQHSNPSENTTNKEVIFGA